MAIIYEDNPVRSAGPPPNLDNVDGTKMWLHHFSNSLILTAIQHRPKDFAEKVQATKELATCERKMEFWRKHPRFDQQKAADESLKLKNMWKRT